MKTLAALKRLAPAPAICGLLLLSLGFTSCKTSHSGPVQTLTIGRLLPSGAASLAAEVANDKGFFLSNGLSVKIDYYETGGAAINALMNGEVDMASATEYVVSQQIMGGKSIDIICNESKYQTVSLAVRAETGLQNISDLRGKRIGLTRGTIYEFYLGRLLDLHGMSLRDLVLVDTQQTQIVAAFMSGAVDAVVVPQTMVNQIQAQSAGTILWPAQSDQAGYFLTTCRREWINQHQDTIRRFLRAMDQAESYIIRYPREAKAVARERLNNSAADVASNWPEVQFSLSLDPSLVTAMNDEAHWMISNNLTPAKTAPDFYTSFYLDGLKSVNSDAVGIVR